MDSIAYSALQHNSEECVTPGLENHDSNLKWDPYQLWKTVNLSQFQRSENGVKKSTYITGLLGELDKLTHV